MQNINLNLESTKINSFHFNKAAREFYSLQCTEELNLNVSCNSIREEGIYAIGDLCLAMPKLTACRIIFRKYKHILHSSEISDKGFIEFLKTVSKITQLKELKLNLMNN